MEYPYLNLEYVYLFLYHLFFGGPESGVVGFFQSREFMLFWDTYTAVATVASLLLLSGIVYAFIRISQIRKSEREQFEALAQGSAPKESIPFRADNRWERITKQIHSDNENDWRQAIIEADLILEEIVTRAGYVGDTLGEKMRGIEKSDFTTIDEAWRAHKVRNQIAHAGSNFRLNHREALETIGLYQKVFEEFFYL
jgi:hypothetical protein